MHTKKAQPSPIAEEILDLDLSVSDNTKPITLTLLEARFLLLPPDKNTAKKAEAHLQNPIRCRKCKAVLRFGREKGDKCSRCEHGLSQSPTFTSLEAAEEAAEKAWRR